MDFIFWIIAIVLIVGVVWWLLNRNSSGNSRGSDTVRHDGGLSGGSAAASAEAAGTAGLPGAAGFGGAAEPAPPTTADETPARTGTAAGQQGFVASPETRTPVEAAGEPAAARRMDAAPETGSGTDAVSGQETLPSPGMPATREPEEAGEPLAAGRSAAGPAAAAGPTSPRETTAPDADAAGTQAGGSRTDSARQAEDEWETQWSEAGGATPAASHRAGSDAHTGAATGAASTGAATIGAAAIPGADAQEVNETGRQAGQDTGYVHHAEYTDPHAPTLPGAETAAADALTADDAAVYPGGSARETPPARHEQGAEPVAAAGGRSEQGAEPMGHLAADQPYGAGSASPGPDGSGPADFDVKGDASAMVYYEEGHPDYEQTTADVWFESAAHAEAAGFRAPRRTRR